MVRKLKFHEKKLLKKTDFISWSVDNNIHEVKVMKKYHVQRREDYTAYNKLSRHIRTLAQQLKELDQKDPFRITSVKEFLSKLHSLGLIPTRKTLALADKVCATSFCRRRLPVVMVRAKMAETMKAAVTLVEQGHVRVGPETIFDPAYLVTRAMEDYVTWTDRSAIKQRVADYTGERDDFDLLE